jgi:hypothetical protein
VHGQQFDYRAHHSNAHEVHEQSNKQNGLAKSDQAFHKIADSSNNKQACEQTATKKAARKAIPLEGDENTNSDDFSEFSG